MIIKKKVRAVVFMLTAFALMLGFGAVAMLGKTGTTATAYAATDFKVAVLSDTHYYSTSFMSNSDAFKDAAASERNLLAESGGILDAALAEIKADAPNVLLITGDLTAHGELLGHTELVAKLEAFRSETGIKTYVINGNNDVNNTNSLAKLSPYRAVTYADGEMGFAQAIDQTDFKTLYKNFGYSDSIAEFTPIGAKAGSLSYVVRPQAGYTVIAVDNCIYTSDVTGTGTDIAEMGGVMNEALLSWVTAQAQSAKDKGDAVIVFQHHGITSILSEDSMFEGALTSGADNIASAYAEAGIELVLSSHTQANDISTFESGNKTVYDIQNGSITAYPGSYKMMEFSKGKKNVSVDIKTNFLKKFTYTNPATGEAVTVDDLTVYSKDNTKLTAKNAFSFIDEVVRIGLDGFLADGGLSELLKDKEDTDVETNEDEETESLLDIIEGLIAGMLEDLVDPIPVANGMFMVSYNKEPKSGSPREPRLELQVNLDDSIKDLILEMLGASDPAMAAIIGIFLESFTTGTVYITVNSIVNLFVNIMKDVETKFLEDFSYLSGQLYEMTKVLMEYTPDKMDNKLGDILNQIYQGYMMGDEEAMPLAEELASKFTDTDFNEQDDILAALMPTIIATIEHIMGSVEVDMSELISGGDNSQLVSLLQSALGSGSSGGILGGDGSSAGLILDMLGGSEKFIETVMGRFLDEDGKKELNATIRDSIISLSTDTNYKNDKNTIITIGGKSSGCGGCGCGTVNFTTFIFFGGLMILASMFILFAGKKRKPSVQN